MALLKLANLPWVLVISQFREEFVAKGGKREGGYALLSIYSWDMKNFDKFAVANVKHGPNNNIAIAVFRAPVAKKTSPPKIWNGNCAKRPCSP